MSNISAKIISDSTTKSSTSTRLITLQLKVPKFLDAEFEKHRMISSNSSSDRAKPFKRMLSDDPYIPYSFRLNEPGMQGSKLADQVETVNFRKDLQEIYELTVNMLKKHEHIHKQHINRYLLPFAWQDKVATATLDEWEYFLSLRLHNAAQPEIYKLAKCIRTAIDSSTSKVMEYDKWHLPYITDVEKETIVENELILASVARCARVSYSNHDNSAPDIESDIHLYKTLKAMNHLSCFEHVATPMKHGFGNPSDLEAGVSHYKIEKHKLINYSGNFKEWIQHRKLIELEI